MTINTSGITNVTPTPTLKEDGVTLLIDGFIKDGWVLPENRLIEIAAIYKGQRDASYWDYKRLTNLLFSRQHSDYWIESYLDYNKEFDFEH